MYFGFRGCLRKEGVQKEGKKEGIQENGEGKEREGELV